MDTAKIQFAVSSYSLERGKKHIGLDNYIKNNNPDYEINDNLLLRTSKDDWIRDGLYVDKKCQKYLKIISKRLETIHNISKSEKYWQKMFYIGLKRYISLVYEFFIQVESRFDINLNFSTLDKESFYTPYDLEDLRDYLSNSECAQEQLFTIYYNLFYQNNSNDLLYIENDFKDHMINLKENTYVHKTTNTKAQILVFGVGCDIEELQSISRISNKRIELFDFIPFYKSEHTLNHNIRIQLSSFEKDFDKFDKFFFKTLETLCPKILIENYKIASEYYSLTLKNFPNLIYIMCEYWISNHQMSFLIAEAEEMLIKFIYNEHNGLQHPFLNNFGKDFGNIVDFYLTIGWENKDAKQQNFISAGILHNQFDMNKIPKYSYNQKKHILYMTAPIYVKRTNYNGINFFMGEDSKYFLNFQKNFFSHLTDEVISDIKYRMAPISNIKKWLTYCPKRVLNKYLILMEHDNLKNNGIQAMLNSKLVIINYLGSGYLQSLILNIPTILFFNNNCYLDDTYNDIFKELIEAKIMQVDSKMAASFLIEIEQNPNNWWYNKKVQDAKNNFLNKVIKSGSSFKDVLFKFLQNTKKNGGENNLTKLNLEFYKNEDLYSDGNVENEILDIVKYTDDYDAILSETDKWPILYHLSPHRRNLLEWYAFDKDKTLLEIGGGCGAFSGMFADKLKEVKVIELSKRRSEIIYNRHSNYDNLEIIVGNLSDIKLENKFDYVTLIGVLEYAGKFTKGQNPFYTFLNQIKQYLKEDGKLLLAIENKFGLKYWAGAKEDHTGKYFDSIENYPEDKSVQTFGKYEIEQMLKNVGFNQLNFYYPMPDYKLPNIIYSDSFLPSTDSLFDIYSPNFDNERYVLFNEREVFKNIIANKQFPFFANSFLIEASL